MPFGKFHDHTLGQIAAFEPSYIDWVAGTVNHDPDLVSAARVVQADLDLRGVRAAVARADAERQGDDPQPPDRDARKREIAPRYRRATMTRMNSMSAAAPTVTRPVGRRPVTRLVSRTRDRPSRTSSESKGRVQFRDRRPRYLPVRSRGGVAESVRPSDVEGNGTLVPVRAPSKVGRIRRTAPGRSYQVRGRTTPAGSGRCGSGARGTRDTLWHMPRPSRSAAASSRSLLVLGPEPWLAACGGTSVPSSRSIRRRPCTADGRFSGAYPDLEALDPDDLPGRPDPRPSTLVATARRPTSARSRPWASREVRFAGGTWTFGAERASSWPSSPRRA